MLPAQRHVSQRRRGFFLRLVRYELAERFFQFFTASGWSQCRKFALGGGEGGGEGGQFCVRIEEGTGEALAAFAEWT
jgi:hypothetical protein